MFIDQRHGLMRANCAKEDGLECILRGEADKDGLWEDRLYLYFWRQDETVLTGEASVPCAETLTERPSNHSKYYRSKTPQASFLI